MSGDDRGGGPSTRRDVVEDGGSVVPGPTPRSPADERSADRRHVTDGGDG